MEKKPNQLTSLTPVATAIAAQNVIRDRSLMLNGGNPIQLGFDTTITFNPLNRDTYKATVAKADPKLFPAGLKGFPAGFLDFAIKAEPELFKWLATKENLSQFTANPVTAFQKFCTDTKIQLPADIKAFLGQTQKGNAAIKYNMPGVKFKSITSNLAQIKK